MPSVGDVSRDPVHIGVSAAAVVLLLLVMGFIGELFNNTFLGNYDRIVTWWGRGWLGRIYRAFTSLGGGGAP